jgi:hypothetical protein
MSLRLALQGADKLQRIPILLVKHLRAGRARNKEREMSLSRPPDVGTNISPMLHLARNKQRFFMKRGRDITEAQSQNYQISRKVQ